MEKHHEKRVRDRVTRPFIRTKIFLDEEKYTDFMSGYERVSQMLTQLAKSLT
jgi:hypothetical protein